jgi:hypothetical protein
MQQINTIKDGAISVSQRKITLGFKCSPSVKAYLALDAESKGLTLSAYVESLIIAMPKLNDQLNYFIIENQNIQNKIDSMSKRISVYENKQLNDLYKNNLNKIVTYTNKKGDIVEKEILILQDVYEVIINSFQYTI